MMRMHGEGVAAGILGSAGTAPLAISAHKVEKSATVYAVFAIQ